METVQNFTANFPSARREYNGLFFCNNNLFFYEGVSPESTCILYTMHATYGTCTVV
jgi:hypothetical protein